MGYCDRHDTVYRGSECPACTGEGEEASTDHTSEPSRGAKRTQDEQRKQASDTINEHISDIASDALDTSATVANDDGDVVFGDQNKSVEQSKHVDVDNSETTETSQTETHETTVTNEDTVMKDVDIGVEESDTSAETGVPVERQNPDADSVETEYCTHCGTSVPVAATTCLSCGERVD